MSQLRTQLAHRLAFLLAVWLLGCSAFQFTPANSWKQCPTAPTQVVPIVIRDAAGIETDILWRAPMPGEKAFQVCLCDTVKKAKNGGLLPPKLEPFICASRTLAISELAIRFGPILGSSPSMIGRLLEPPTPPPNNFLS